jgi:transcriptional accessory protein Tex/SPT6
VQVKVVEVDPARKRIALSMKLEPAAPRTRGGPRASHRPERTHGAAQGPQSASQPPQSSPPRPAPDKRERDKVRTPARGPSGKDDAVARSRRGQRPAPTQGERPPQRTDKALAGAMAEALARALKRTKS